jgi:hypothetical protein
MAPVEFLIKAEISSTLFGVTTRSTLIGFSWVMSLTISPPRVPGTQAARNSRKITPIREPLIAGLAVVATDTDE